jgi:hypothetical protein
VTRKNSEKSQSRQSVFWLRLEFAPFGEKKSGAPSTATLDLRLQVGRAVNKRKPFKMLCIKVLK